MLEDLIKNQIPMFGVGVCQQTVVSSMDANCALLLVN